MGRGNKVCSRDLDHMTKMAATSINGKNHSKLKNLHLEKRRADFHILGMSKHRGLQPIIVCANNDPGHFGNIGFYMGKSENYGFF